MASSNMQGGGDSAPIVKRVKRRSNESIIWKFCKKTPGREFYVTCDLCNLVLSQGGKNSNWGTSGFRYHMKSNHSDIWAKALDEKCEQDRHNEKKHKDNAVSNYFKTLSINNGNKDTSITMQEAFTTHIYTTNFNWHA